MKRLLAVSALMLYALLFTYFDTPAFFENPPAFFATRNFYYFFIVSFSDAPLRYVLPIAAILPLGLSVAEDRASRFYDMEAGRCTWGRFMFRRTVSAVASALIAIGIACLIFTIILLIFCPLSGGEEESWLQFQQEYVWMATVEHFLIYVIWRIGLTLIGSMIWVSAAMLLSLCWANSAFVLIGTFAVSVLADSILSKHYGIDYTIGYLQSPDFFQSETPFQPLLIRLILYAVIALAVLAIAVILRGNRRLQRAAEKLRDRFRDRMTGGKHAEWNLSTSVRGTRMGRMLTDLRSCCTPRTLLPAIVIAVFLMLVMPRYLEGGYSIGDLLMNAFGGIYWFEPEASFELIGYWVLALLPVMFGIALNLNRELGGRTYLSIAKFPSRWEWWISKWVSLSCYTVVASACMFLTAVVYGLLTGHTGFGVIMEDTDGFPFRDSFVVFRLFVIFTLHLLMISQVQIFFHVLTNRAQAGFIAFLLPLIYCVITYSIFDRSFNEMVPYNWGMILRSEIFSSSYMQSESGKQIPLCAIPVRTEMLGQAALWLGGGCMNMLLGKWIRFTEREIRHE